jgi:RNA polymerase sigma factor (sigma-70 family)
VAGRQLKGVLTHIRELFAAREQDGHSDRDLLNRFIKDRDEAAVAVLIERHAPMVLGICRRVLGHAHDAEDACQAAFLVLVRKAASVRKKESLASWLHGVAFHVATNLARERARRRRREGAVAKPAGAAAAEDLTWREGQLALDEELARLPERFRAPLVLCYLEGKTRDEAARQLHWTLGVLRGRLERGRALLCARLTRRGLAFSAALLACQVGAGAAAAAMEPAFAISTIKAVMLTRIGSTAIPAKVVALAEGALKAMLMSRLKIATAVFLAIMLAGAGLALLVQGAPRAAADPAVPEPQAKKPAAKPAQPLPADAGAKPRADTGRPIRSLSGHKDRVTSVAYSPDGRWIATAAWDGTARLWDAQTGDEVRRLIVPPTRDYPTPHLTRILFSPDNAFVVVAFQAAPNETGVIIWNRRTGEKAHELLGGSGSMAMSPDGKYIASGGWDNASCVIRIYELATGKLVREINSRSSLIVSLTYSPDGNTLFAQVGIPRPPLKNGLARLGMDPIKARSWDVATGRVRRTGLEHDGAWCGHVFVFSPDGRTLAIGTSLFETATGGGRAKLIGYKDLENGVAFSPDGRTFAMASSDGTVRLWDLPSGKAVGRFGKLVDSFKGGWVLTVAFSPDGRTLVSGGLDRKAHVWDVSRITSRQRAVAERSPADLEADWKGLAGDAAKGYAALGRLVSSPRRAVAFVGKQLQNTKPLDTKRIEQLIADLDDGRFKVREQATRELEASADRARPVLRRALAGTLSPEARRRLSALLDRLENGSPSAETVRQIRAVEALESIGGPDARRLLDKLAAGPPDTRLTHEAKAALGRLAKRGSGAR